MLLSASGQQPKSSHMSQSSPSRKNSTRAIPATENPQPRSVGLSPLRPRELKPTLSNVETLNSLNPPRPSVCSIEDWNRLAARASPPTDPRPNDNSQSRPSPSAAPTVRAPFRSRGTLYWGDNKFSRRQNQRKAIDLSGWENWDEVKIRVENLPGTTTTRALYQTFCEYGSISRIDVLKGRFGRGPVAYIIFCPPPDKPVWNGTPMFLMDKDTASTVLLNVTRPQEQFGIPRQPSLVNPDTMYRQRTILMPDTLEFGLMQDLNTMMSMQNIAAHAGHHVFLTLNLQRKELEAMFPVIRRSGSRNEEIEIYRFVVPLEHMKVVYEVKRKNEQLELIILLDAPPSFYRKTKDVGATHDDNESTWTVWRTWFRETDIIHYDAQYAVEPIRLRKDNPIIDIGRWTTYRFVLGPSTDYAAFCHALIDYNITVIRDEHINRVEKSDIKVWEMIDLPEADRASALSAFNTVYLPFPIRYQLEVCISHGILNEHNLAEAFIHRLASLSEVDAKDILERVADSEERFYDPMEIFNITIIRSSEDRAVPEGCCVTYAAN
ncbi:hypothetical protein LTS18_002776, partial [Coniosporium uncinatum]